MDGNKLREVKNNLNIFTLGILWNLDGLYVFTKEI